MCVFWQWGVRLKDSILKGKDLRLAFVFITLTTGKQARVRNYFRHLKTAFTVLYHICKEKVCCFSLPYRSVDFIYFIPNIWVNEKVTYPVVSWSCWLITLFPLISNVFVESLSADSNCGNVAWGDAWFLRYMQVLCNFQVKNSISKFCYLVNELLQSK